MAFFLTLSPLPEVSSNMTMEVPTSEVIAAEKRRREAGEIAVEWVQNYILYLCIYYYIYICIYVLYIYSIYYIYIYSIYYIYIFYILYTIYYIYIYSIYYIAIYIQSKNSPQPVVCQHNKDIQSWKSRRLDVTGIWMWKIHVLCIQRFLKSRYPQITHFLGGFSILNLPAIGYSPIYGNPEIALELVHIGGF